MAWEYNQKLAWICAGVSSAAAVWSFSEVYRLRRSISHLTVPDNETPCASPANAEESSLKATASDDLLLAGVELGGTSCVVAVCHPSSPTVLVDRFEVPTTTPQETLNEIMGWLESRGPFVAVGVASFGPVDLDTNSSSYGWILNTPKKKWKGFPLLSSFEPLASKSLCDLTFDTDVNAPAMAELVHFNRTRDVAVSSCAYITVGTGIGVGLVVNGAPIHGLLHPEGGHLMPTVHPDDTYVCEWTELHPTSIESMAAAQACADRCGVPTSDLASVRDDHPEWSFVAYYIAQLALSITFLVSPHFIVISGGVMKRRSLFPKIRSHFKDLNDGYIDRPEISQALDSYIVPSSFGNDAGIIGACELGRQDLIRKGKL